MSKTTISRGNVMRNNLVGISITPTAVSGTSAEQTFTVVGLRTQDFVEVNFNGAQTTGVGIGNVRVSATDTLAITFTNATGGSATPAAGTYVVHQSRPEDVTLPSSLV